MGERFLELTSLKLCKIMYFERKEIILKEIEQFCKTKLSQAVQGAEEAKIRSQDCIVSVSLLALAWSRHKVGMGLVSFHLCFPGVQLWQNLSKN